MKPRPILRLVLLNLCLAVGLAGLRADATPDWSKKSARPTPDWIRQSVVYEIFPRQYSATGNFAGITASLDRLKWLGVDVLWLMPIHPLGKEKAKGSVGSPYAVQDYYAVNPDYGTKEDFRQLVDAAHARGMKVIIDIVANHTAWDSVMMSHPGYYKQDATGKVISPHDWWDVAGLNYANPETHRYMRDMLQYWAKEFHLDGFRCDVAGEVPTDFWEEVRQELEKIRPGIFLLAEANKPELVVNAFDSDYAWPMQTTLNKVMMEGAPASDLRRTWELDEQKTFPKGALHLRTSDNHDEARAVTRFGWHGALAASALMFSLDGVPLIYNGMEVGDSTESGDPALFEKLPIFWAPKQREKFPEIYRQLVALRHQHAALTAGSVVWLENSNPENVVTLLRRNAEEEIVTVINFSNRPQGVAVRLAHGTDFKVLLGVRPAAATEPTALPQLVLGAFEWTIFHRPLK